MATNGKRLMRIQLDLPEERVQELDELMREINMTTRKDLFNTALTLLVWVINERKEDRIIASLDKKDDSYRELVMPFFSFLRSHRKKPFAASN
jgi:metal-responsive CopG/Arc/MetJ family transcriptional regulator